MKAGRFVCGIRTVSAAWWQCVHPGVTWFECTHKRGSSLTSRLLTFRFVQSR